MLFLIGYKRKSEFTELWSIVCIVETYFCILCSSGKCSWIFTVPVVHAICRKLLRILLAEKANDSTLFPNMVIEYQLYHIRIVILFELYNHAGTGIGYATTFKLRYCMAVSESGILSFIFSDLIKKGSVLVTEWKNMAVVLDAIMTFENQLTFVEAFKLA